jgi:AcrR family transcriptional regulator
LGIAIWGRPVKEKSLSPQDVIDAAIACLDAEGESALGVNRVAKELGIKPPAIYKHLDGNAGLRRAVALAIWRSYLADCQQQTTSILEPRSLFRIAAIATRNFARSYPARYAVMMQYQMKPSDGEELEIIRESLGLFKNALQLYELNEDGLIDAMRMVNAAIYGFIIREQSELMTLNRSADDSYGVMLDALIVAIEYIHGVNYDRPRKPDN